MEIVRLGVGDEQIVAAMSHVFDEPARPEHTRRFLEDDRHHLLVARQDNGVVGFVSGVEMTHPDKGTEMFLYELAVDEPWRRRGIGAALVTASIDLAQQRGCYGMWVLTDDSNAAAAVATYTSSGGELADQWNVGAVSSAEVFAALADATTMTTAEVAAHAGACCARLDIHRNAWKLAERRVWRQAIVTVNPDLFAEFIVPTYDLVEMFDEIVMSFAEHTDDKVALCDIALDRLGYRGDRGDALLIDNRSDLVAAWRRSGGAGYWFQTDDQFGRDSLAFRA